MKIIADSGSTKTNWCLLQDSGETSFVHTHGLNPFFRTTAEIREELEKSLVPEISGKVAGIYFYGAGVTDSSKGEIVAAALRPLFPDAIVETQSDLLAAARATCGHQPGIACILGTGSNSCYYNGSAIMDHISPLGFILGDEGSGAVMGRKLVGDYLKNVMPAELRDEFRSMYPFSSAEILEKVYRQPRPNKFLAEFTRFLSAKIHHPYCRYFVKLNFREFIERNVMNYSNARELKVHFIGSLAFYFQEILFEVLDEAGLKKGIILQEPMAGLIIYHRQ